LVKPFDVVGLLVHDKKASVLFATTGGYSIIISGFGERDTNILPKKYRCK